MSRGEDGSEVSLLREELAREVPDVGLVHVRGGDARLLECLERGLARVVLERRVLALPEVGVPLPDEVGVELADEGSVGATREEDLALELHGRASLGGP